MKGSNSKLKKVKRSNIQYDRKIRRKYDERTTDIKKIRAAIP
jgi:hypothetical protein